MLLTGSVLRAGDIRRGRRIPVALAALLWQGTAGLSAAESESLCDQLDTLSLLTLAWAGPIRVIVMHDVIRDYALHLLGSARRAVVHAALVDAARQATGPDAAAGLPRDREYSAESSETEWWRLPQTANYGYLWEYLSYHLQGAGLDTELDQVCCDLRFLAIRLERSGPAAMEADLARSRSPLAARLRRTIAQNAHLLSPIEPADALITTLTSRLAVSRNLPPRCQRSDPVCTPGQPGQPGLPWTFLSTR